jgi:hypothetical protein
MSAALGGQFLSDLLDCLFLRNDQEFEAAFQAAPREFATDAARRASDNRKRFPIAHIALPSPDPKNAGAG